MPRKLFCTFITFFFMTGLIHGEMDISNFIFDDEVFGLNVCNMAEWLQAELYLVRS